MSRQQTETVKVEDTASDVPETPEVPAMAEATEATEATEASEASAPVAEKPAETSATTAERSALTGELSDLALWTGGRAFAVSTIAERSVVARQIVEELRHQYLIAFESSDRPGWHPLEVRTRDKDLSVRARSGYFAGQSRPISD